MFQLLLIILCLSLVKCNSEIHTSTTCEGQSTVLECPTGDVILIKNANYGRTDGFTCPHSAMSNQNCFSGNSLTVVSNTCNNKPKCTITSSNGVFGDPCYGTYKYLKVEYQCISAAPCKANEFQCNNGLCISETQVSDGFKDCPAGEDEQGHDYISEYACEGHDLRIYCRKDEVISVINANYGRLTSNICPHPQISNQNCKSANSLQIIANRCNQKGYCIVPSTNSVFGDPCYGTYKYTEVHYECVQKPNCTQNEFQCNHGHCIDISKKCDGYSDCEKGEDEHGCNYLTEIACENSNLRIECKTNHVIKIIGANYGRQLQHVCNNQPVTNCVAAVSKKKVQDRCNGLRTCNISANNGEFGDPCPGTIKYLSVNYICENRSTNIIPDVE